MTPERQKALDEYVETIKKGPEAHHITDEEKEEIYSYLEIKFHMKKDEMGKEFSKFIIEFPLFWVLSREFKK